MDFKQRVLTALNYEEPDRVPVLGLIAEPATSNAILGRPPSDIAAMLANPDTRGQIKDLINSSWPELVYANFSDALEAAIKMGFDANWTTYTSMDVVEDPEARQGLACHDIVRRRKTGTHGRRSRGPVSTSSPGMPPSITRSWQTATATGSCPSATPAP
jgi:hypothetical protein